MPDDALLFGVFEFQLHHTGIKIFNFLVKEVGESEFQLHHTGIKMHLRAVRDIELIRISIAPYRN